MYTADLSTTDQKFAARAEGVALYRELTGLHSLPADGQYWTLANRQSTAPVSEIEQCVAAGLLSKRQFHGVDFDPDIIAANKADHPTAHWHCGSWENVISENEFNPAMIYLDTTGTADCKRTAKLITRTMQLAPIGCVLLANVMLTNPYDGSICDPQVLLSNIADSSTEAELDAWGWSSLRAFEYSSGRTRMLTVALMRRAIAAVS